MPISPEGKGFSYVHQFQPGTMFPSILHCLPEACNLLFMHHISKTIPHNFIQRLDLSSARSTSVPCSTFIMIW
uniref:Uncharacterized protein n=1 Tax=Arundo donax TaxID=35708 RepID=A0A0A9GQJ8_ARUDO